MWIVLRRFEEEILAVGMVVLRGGFSGEWRLNPLSICDLECTIHLVGGDVVKQFAVIVFRTTLPIEFCCLKERQRAHHVGLRKREWVFD